MKFIFILTTYLLISSCYVYSPRFVNVEFDYNLNAKFETDKKIDAIIEEPKIEIMEKEVIKFKCNKFNLPKPLEIPLPPTSFQIKNAKTQADLDLLLVEHINKLKAFIVKERERIEIEYSKYIKDC